MNKKETSHNIPYQLLFNINSTTDSDELIFNAIVCKLFEYNVYRTPKNEPITTEMAENENKYLEELQALIELLKNKF